MTKKTDVDVVAQNYLRNNVNAYINPYHAAWYPGGGIVNTAYLASFTTTPGAATPSQNVLIYETQLRGAQVRAAVIELGNYYANITRGVYGLRTSDGVSNWTTYPGTGYFSVNYSPPGVDGKVQDIRINLNALPDISGVIQYSQLTANYNAAWAIIYNRRDQLTVDLTVCHSSCHTSCHGSRGRR